MSASDDAGTNRDRDSNELPSFERSPPAEVPERLVQEFLAKNLSVLGIPGLELMGMEYQVPSGRIDILAKSSDRRLIAIEVKRGTATRDAVGQLQSYVGDLLAEGVTGFVGGLLVAARLDQGARSALLATPSIEFWSYEVAFTFSRLPISRPHSNTRLLGSSTCPVCGRDTLSTLKSTGERYCSKCGNFVR